MKYAILFAYSDEAVSHMLTHPSDRAVAVTKLIEAAGGRLEDFYWMLGPYDGICIVEMPDGKTMASVAMAVISKHALRRFESYELIEHGDIPGLEQRAREVVKSYQPPGEEQ